MGRVIDNMVYAAEDLMGGGNPNLAKMWNQEYAKEMITRQEHSKVPKLSENRPKNQGIIIIMEAYAHTMLSYVTCKINSL